MSDETNLEKFSPLTIAMVRAIRSDPSYTQDFADAALTILRRRATTQAKQDQAEGDKAPVEV